MYYSPHSHLALAKAHHEELQREADRRRLAKLLAESRPSRLSRILQAASERRLARKHPAPVTG
jgi:hypothetical protein